MTDNHPHMPPIIKNTASYLSPGKIVIVVGGHMHVLTRDEAMSLAMSLVDVLQLEVTK